MNKINESKIRKQLEHRMSLHAPQIKSVDILSDVVNTIELSKSPDLAAQLSAIQAKYEGVADFERNFPSLCFALATGVGKTRLMGAFITYLFQIEKAKNFFVLAPNTTVYEKLIADFTPATPKYVFRGIAEFATNPPLIITGDTWEQGRGVRGTDFLDNLSDEVIINIFNVDKINRDDGKIRRMHEIIGASYFDYLASLPDLVMLMDEAHRYRAKAAFKAIEELQPILGLELTATPKSVGTKSQPFKNVIYEYKLGDAMADGFVKEPAVVTRTNFDAAAVNQERLEEIKLEDAVHCHKETKAHLVQFSRNNNRELVHPFILVVAQDTKHASEIKEFITSKKFFKGQYAGKVIEIHSNTKGEESEDATARLLAVESDPNTEIVIHVNKLKEGWDVNNLYTIVPLRASASSILTEQTLGRGLRLPYGQRVNDEVVDGLKIIAHDRFDAVIEEARKDGSLVRMKAFTVGEDGDISPTTPIIIDVKPSFIAPLIGASDDEDQIVKTTIEIFKKQAKQLTGGLNDLRQEKTKKEIVREVIELTPAAQAEYVPAIVEKSIEEFVGKTIEIPHIEVMPKDDVHFGFHDFDLGSLASINFQPIDDDIQITQLRTEARSYLVRSGNITSEENLENYIVRYLRKVDEIDYDAHAALLNKLAGQMISHLRSYLDTKEKIENVCLAFGAKMAGEIFSQMKPHMWETPTDFEVHVMRSYRVEEGEIFTAPSEDHIKDFTQAVKPLSNTRKHIFKGFSEKACKEYYKFDSNPERKFAVLIDKRTDAVKLWMRPSSKSIEIMWESGKNYKPDFIVETEKAKLIVEIKASNELDDPEVVKKANATTLWIERANELANKDNKKQWTYLLINENKITESATLSALIAQCKYSPKK